MTPTKPEASVDSAARVRRRNGQGGIEIDRVRKMFRGQYRDALGERVRLPWCHSERDAEEQLQAALELLQDTHGLSVGGITLRSWGNDFLDKREREGNRAVHKDRSRWQYVAGAAFIDWPLASITSRDVKRWMGEMNLRKTHGRGRPKAKAGKRVFPTKALSWQTKAHALNLLRQAFVVAIEDEIVGDDVANPCVGLKFKRPPTIELPTNFFTRPEIERIQGKAPPLFCPLLEFAIATGLRQGEMRALRDTDVHLDAETPYITVRYGRPPLKPTKSGQPRAVPLLPMAQRALRSWYGQRATWCKNNFKGLTFPAQYGGYRSEGKFLGRRNNEIWNELLRASAIDRHLVWHDLRHTCATALLGGYFGRQWRLEEIQQFLGHADVETTQRYAHALQQTLNEAARATWGDITPPVRA
jgi:integrase